MTTERLQQNPCKMVGRNVLDEIIKLSGHHSEFVYTFALFLYMYHIYMNYTHLILIL